MMFCRVFLAKRTQLFFIPLSTDFYDLNSGYAPESIGIVGYMIHVYWVKAMLIWLKFQRCLCVIIILANISLTVGLNKLKKKLGYLIVWQNFTVNLFFLNNTHARFYSHTRCWGNFHHCKLASQKQHQEMVWRGILMNVFLFVPALRPMAKGSLKRGGEMFMANGTDPVKHLNTLWNKVWTSRRDFVSRTWSDFDIYLVWEPANRLWTALQTDFLNTIS